MIILVDFGSQTAHLIARRIRDLGSRVEIVLPADAPAFVEQHKPAGIILSGSPEFVTKKGAPTLPQSLFEKDVPILGICYGHQLMNHVLGGTVTPSSVKEYGPALLSIIKSSPLLAVPVSHFQVWMSHGDKVVKPAPGFVSIAKTQSGHVSAVANENKKLYSIQFHPEVVHTQYGTEILANFLRICGITPKHHTINLTTLNAIVAGIKEKIGTGRAICGLSGGIDSSVAAVLVHRAIGNRLTCVYVDSGLMRQGETDEIRSVFGKHFKLQLRIVDAKKEFLKALKGITDPEEKRLSIGKLFIDIFESEAQKIGSAQFLVQGTIYPDVIESKGTQHAQKIKSHHNVGGLPKDLRFTLIEPLRELYKDEVRSFAKLLKFPTQTLTRQPFPGPGLAIRIIGEVTEEKLATLRHADAIVREIITKNKLNDKTWQAFAVHTGIKTTGVRGDERSYGDTIAIRVVDAVDAMSAHWSRLPYEVLDEMSVRIVNEVPSVNRVLYDITNKPPGTMEWE